jgi:pantetheine-phosphate adenylyltransferase
MPNKENFLISEDECTSAMHALITGSFDPVTVGHLDIIKRASNKFQKVTACVFVNPNKEYLLSLAEKEALLRIACKNLSNVSVTSDVGMVCDFCKAKGVDVIVRGVRNEEDRVFELVSAKYNWEHSGIKTLLLPADPAFTEISSSDLKHRLQTGENVGKLLPDGVEEPFFNILLQQL